MDYSIEINGYTLEYYEDGHCYLVDGMFLPSITQILKVRFGNKYDGISKAVLDRAAAAGTAVHEAIENYCRYGTESDLPELRNFKFLQKAYGFTVMKNEIPVILFDNDFPIAVGRLDMEIEIDGQLGGADIKRTATLDKEYLAYQLNLYRIAYKQSYGIEWAFLKGIHLRNDIRKLVPIPIDEEKAWELIREFQTMEGKNE